jgi:hypothetical protein
MRTTAITLPLFATLALTAACNQRELATLDPRPTGEERIEFQVEKNRNLDLLFVVDDSFSMDAEQILLTAEFPEMIRVLEQIDGGLPNLHLAVISTDLGAGPYSNDGCDDGAGKNGEFQSSPRQSGCSAPMGPFIRDVDDGTGNRERNYSGTLAETFSCIARLGTSGCGFEQPLEAMRRALNGSNPANANFLRKDALLAVIFITDEDDCSTYDTSMFAPSTDPESFLGPKKSFRCFEFGVTCDVSDPRELGERSSCEPNESSQYMEGVQQYVEFLRGLKQWESQIMVAGIVGDPSPIRVIRDDDNYIALDYSCGTATSDAQAVPPVRLKAFLDAFEQTSSHSICSSTLAPALTDIADRIVDSLETSCVLGHLQDIDPDADGVQPDCKVSELRPGQPEALLPECSNLTDPLQSAELPCYTILENRDACPDTPTGLTVAVHHADSDTVPPTTDVSARCMSAGQ